MSSEKQKAQEQLQVVAQKIEQLRVEFKALEAVVNKKEVVSILKSERDRCHYLVVNESRTALESSYQPAQHGGEEDINQFPSEHIAQCFAEAFNTILALNHCDGSKKAQDAVYQYGIEADGGIVNFLAAYHKKMSVSPVFSSLENAKAAIAKVGKDNIIKMYNTLSGIF